MIYPLSQQAINDLPKIKRSLHDRRRRRKMTPERWQQIKQLVNSALEQNAEQRSAVLQQSCAEACADDLPLLKGAEALLSFHEQATRNLSDGHARLNAQQTPSPEQWERIEKIFQSAMELEL